ncbi:hypothetical protein D9Q98_006295 [Chlorella vulgaris]|uniref:Nucleoplasmin-like domain-containing protein n=1 Tax=Chlorella vulgaris TaxID=3077 RepID=A0A9D4TXD5_CHLVU|nr:hypothetical protein D9Q98_006295 [Chlorella vulgaris]
MATGYDFTGVIVPAGASVRVTAEYDEEQYETYHFSQAALGAKPKPGPHTLFIEKGGQKYAIGTLDASRCMQFPCDITLAMDEVLVSHNGTGEVHLTGYRMEQLMPADSSDDEYAGYGSEEGSEEERGSQEDSEADSEEDEEVPRAVPLNGLSLRAGKARLRQLVDDEAEEGGSDSDQSLEPQQQRGARFAYEAGAAPAPHATFAPFGAPPHNHGLAAFLDTSSDEESLSSGEEEEEDEVEAPPAPAPVQQKQSQAHGTKRLAAQQAAQTPQPAKKAKAEAQGKAPATAPAKLAAIARLDAAHAAKAQAGKDKKEVPAPTNEKEYVAALKAALQAADGPLKLATLGTRVKRPPSLPKIKSFMEKHSAVFAYSKENDTVALK